MASTDLPAIERSRTIIAVRSHGLRNAPNSGTNGRSRCFISSGGCGIGTPCTSAASVAAINAPPDAPIAATPRDLGRPALAKNAAVSTRRSISGTTINPARSNSAMYASVEPASEPVCDNAAVAASLPLPSLQITTALPAFHASSPASSNCAGCGIPSNKQAIAAQPGSPARNAISSAMCTSEPLPNEST